MRLKRHLPDLKKKKNTITIDCNITIKLINLLLD